MQLIKGGFSYRAKKEIGFSHDIWQPSYYDRRVRDVKEYFAFRDYVRQNPVKRSLAAEAKRYRYCSAWPEIQLDDPPQRLKPLSVGA